MKFLRTISTTRLLALIAGFVAAAVGCTAIALAATNGGAKPPPKPLANALHDAISAPPVQGLSARIKFTNHLVDSAAIPGANPLLKGASGRLWLGSGHRLRLELQGDNGDSQIVVNGESFSVYDASSNTVYRGQLPSRPEQAGAKSSPPSLSEIQTDLGKLAGKAHVSGANPSNVAGQPAYTVRVTPTDGSGLLNGAALAWDAARGVPLRVAIYARGSSSPVLELTATGISYGDVPASAFAISPPANAKKIDVTPSGPGKGGKGEKPVTGLNAVAKAVPFKLSAPNSLAGMPRTEVKLVHWGDSPAALVTYGEGLGSIAVVERAQTASSSGDSLNLPSVDINGVKGNELDTALGTLVRFKRGNVTYTVAGSVKPDTAKSAARGL
ncbi:MAG: LolA family protein [Thermoleophilaceae bacterium]